MLSVAPTDQHDTVFAVYATYLISCIWQSINLSLTNADLGSFEAFLGPIEQTICGELTGFDKVYKKSEVEWLHRKMEEDERYRKEAANVRHDLEVLTNPQIDDWSIGEILKHYSRSRRWQLNELFKDHHGLP